MKISVVITTHNDRLVTTPFHPIIDEVIIIRDVSPAFEAKLQGVKQAKNEYVLLLDSDDVFSTEFFDTIEKFQLDDMTLYCPAHAAPYNYTEFSKEYITRYNVRRHIDSSIFTAFLLTGNYLFNRETYLEVCCGDILEVYAADCVYLKHLWLKSGFVINIDTRLKYNHTVSNTGYFSTTHDNTWPQVEKIKRMILSYS